MKKTIWPRHPLHLSSLVFYISILLFLVYGTIIYFKHIVIPTGLDLQGVLVIVGFFYVFDSGVSSLFYALHNRAIIKDDRLIITGHSFRAKDDVLQSKDEILYDEIETVVLVYTHVNSRQRPIKTWGTNSMRAYLYFEFLLKNGESKLMYIGSYSGRQRKQILDVFNERTGLNLVYNQLEKRNESVLQTRRKERRRKNKKKNEKKTENNNSTETK